MLTRSRVPLCSCLLCFLICLGCLAVGGFLLQLEGFGCGVVRVRVRACNCEGGEGLA